MKFNNISYILAALLLLAAAMGWIIFPQLFADSEKIRGKGHSSGIAPVEVALIKHGPIELKRTFSGALEAVGQFVVAPKISGRVERLAVDISDSISRGQIIAQLDNAEFIQAVEQAKADVAVAQAKLAEAQSLLKIASREAERVGGLLGKHVASQRQLDEATAKELGMKAGMEVAQAQLDRAKSHLKTAQIRLSYTQVTADWVGGSAQRVVAERYVDEGDTVSANAPLALIVELDPIKGVFFVTEKDYALLKKDQATTLSTDAYPFKTFEGRIDRIAPLFLESTRQARVELGVKNPEKLLKPGMFMTTTVILGKIGDATIVPDQSITKRNESLGVFVIDEQNKTASWRKVIVGIQEGGQTQVEGDRLSGRVVTLGQHLLDDGSKVSVVSDIDTTTRPGE